METLRLRVTGVDRDCGVEWNGGTMIPENVEAQTQS